MKQRVKTCITISGIWAVIAILALVTGNSNFPYYLILSSMWAIAAHLLSDKDQP